MTNTQTIYTPEQTKQSISGWLNYDAPWQIIRTAYPYIGKSCIDIGAGANIAMRVIQTLKAANNKNFHYKPNQDYRELRDFIAWGWRFETCYSSHVLEHLENPDEMIFLSIELSSGNIIHIVPEGDVQEKNSGTPHLHTYTMYSFLKLFIPREEDKIIKRVHYGRIESERMNSLIYVGEKII